MTDSWETNKEMKRDNSGDRVSRFFILKRDHKIIMKNFALMILVIGLVGVFSGVAIGQEGPNTMDLFLRCGDNCPCWDPPCPGDTPEPRAEFPVLVPFVPSPHLNDIYFAHDSFELDGSAKKTLEKNVNWFKDNPNLKVEIRGHTDQRGENQYNLVLGQKRVQTTKTHLISLGVSGDRIYAISYGEEKPFYLEDTEECHQKTNRVNFLVSRR